MADIDTTVEVGFHLQFYLVPGGELEGSAQSHASIVDEDVNAVLFGVDFLDYLLDAIGVADVTLHVGDGGMLHLSAADTIDFMAVLRQPFGNGFAETGRGSGDDDYFVHCGHFVVQNYEIKMNWQ